MDRRVPVRGVRRPALFIGGFPDADSAVARPHERQSSACVCLFGITMRARLFAPLGQAAVVRYVRPPTRRNLSPTPVLCRQRTPVARPGTSPSPSRHRPTTPAQPVARSAPHQTERVIGVRHTLERGQRTDPTGNKQGRYLMRLYNRLRTVLLKLFTCCSPALFLYPNSDPFGCLGLPMRPGFSPLRCPSLWPAPRRLGDGHQPIPRNATDGKPPCGQVITICGMLLAACAIEPEKGIVRRTLASCRACGTEAVR